jgi:hypothetical protein
MRHSAAVPHLLGEALDLALHLPRRGPTHPDELGASELIQHHVAPEDLRSLTVEHQHRPQPKACGRGRRQPRVVALRRTGRDHRRRALARVAPRSRGARPSVRSARLARFVPTAASFVGLCVREGSG